MRSLDRRQYNSQHSQRAGGCLLPYGRAFPFGRPLVFKADALTEAGQGRGDGAARKEVI